MRQGEINATAVLTRRVAAPDDHFRLVVRWLLGDTQTLPRYNDAFALSLHLTVADRWLQADGSTGEVGEIIEIPAKPRAYVMIEPPRKGIPPSGPVKPVPAQSELPDTEGLGILHVLGEAQFSRMAWRAAVALEPVFRRRLAHAEEISSIQGLAKQAADMARAMASTLVRQGGVRRALAALPAALEELAHSGQPALLAYTGSPGLRWQYAAGFADALADSGLRRELTERVDAMEALRTQLMLKGLLGGSLIDYWAGADTPVEHPDDDDRGKIYPIAELVGLGFTVGPIPSSTVEAWAAANERIEIIVRQTVAGFTPEPSLTGRSDGTAGDLDKLSRTSFSPSEPIVIEGAQFRRALDNDLRSSLPPAAPDKAFIDYDLLEKPVFEQMDPQASPVITRRVMGFGTGDGRLQILIKRSRTAALARATGASALNIGYNVYGVWEEASTRHLFTDPSPEFAQFRAWRVTRRYGYRLQLAPFFPHGGTVHPAVEKALADPPWEPVAPQLTFENPLDGPIVPAGHDQWSFDLRRGAGLPAAEGWQPQVIDPKLDWLPNRDRNGAEARQGQRYRFWVTAVDHAGQESDPILVETADSAGSEAPSHFFVPRFRTPPTPPALFLFESGSPNQRKERIGIGWFPERMELELRCSSSVQRTVGAAAEKTPTSKLAANNVESGAIVLRRPLRRAVDTAMLTRRNAADDDWLHANVWFGAYADLVEQGYTEFARPELTELSDKYWTASIPLTLADRGFEYVALMGFRVVPDFGVIAPEAPKRPVRSSGPEGGVTAKETVAENPRYSSVATTDIMAVVNPERPRGVELINGRVPFEGDPTFEKASPVLPPQGVDRDLVLLRLLERPVVLNGQQQTVADWGGTGFELGLGQAAMLEAALARTGRGGGEPSGTLGDPELALARSLLARDLVRATDNKVLRHSLSVGFRGLWRIAWSYTPLAAGTGPAADEAEAVHLRLYATRIPFEPNAAAAFATVLARGMRIATKPGAVEVQLLEIIQRDRPSDAAALDNVRALPSLAELCPAAHAAAAARGAVIASQDGTGGLPRLTIAVDPNSMPSGELYLRLHVGQVMVEQEIAQSDGPVEQTLLLPVGGGPREIGVLWLATVSAQGRLASQDRQVVLVRELPATVQPDSPALFRVEPPSNDAHWLDPEGTDPEGKPIRNYWLPREVGTALDARVLPRLLVAWQPYADHNVRILVERDRRQVASPVQEQARPEEELSTWRAIRSVHLMADDDNIEFDALSAILRGRWLVGAPVIAEGTPAEPVYLFDRSQSLSSWAGTGIRQIGGQDLACLIDYFRDDRTTPENRVKAMDGTFIYNYRLTPELNLGGDLWLPGRPTVWSGYRMPETSVVGFREPVVSFRDAESVYPSVLFNISVARPAFSMVADAERHWLYRVLVRRERPATAWLRAQPDATTIPAWIPLGEPVELTPTAPTKPFEDKMIARAAVDETLTLVYSLTIQLVLKGTSGEAQDEVLIRGPEGADPPPIEVKFTALGVDAVVEKQAVINVSLL